MFTANTPNTNIGDLAVGAQARIASTATAPSVSKTDGIDRVTETSTVQFTSLLAGESVTVGGLTFTAAKNLVAIDVAKAFASLSAGATGPNTVGGLSSEYGSYSGALSLSLIHI